MLRGIAVKAVQYVKWCFWKCVCETKSRVRKVVAEVSSTVDIYRLVASQLWSSLALYVPLLLYVCRPNIPLYAAAAFLKESIERAGLEPATDGMDYRYVLMTTTPRRLFAADPPSRVQREIRLADLTPSRSDPNGLVELSASWSNPHDATSFRRRFTDVSIRPADLRAATKTYIEALRSFHLGL